jgi:hypothetical protein
MIKHIELRTPEEVTVKLTKVQNRGWNLTNAFINVTYVPEVGFYLFYDSKLPIE